MSPDDIADIVLECCRSAPAAGKDFRARIRADPSRQGKWGSVARTPYNVSYTSLPAPRIFLSECEIKGLLEGGKRELRVPAAAIISPLAEEWFSEKGIRVVRE